MKSCWRQVDNYAKREGLRWLTLSACRSQLDDRVPPELAARFRNPKTYRDRFQPHGEWEPDAFEAGERWDGDHCVLDLMCWWGEGSQRKVIRPWLTAWMDWRTRRIVGWHLSDGPNAQTILSAFRMGMLDEANHGGPGIVWIDNGKDYDSYVFHGMTKAERKQAMRDRMIKRERGRLGKIDGGMRVDEGRARAGVFNLLQIDAHFSLPYNPTGKSRLERWFGTMHDQFDRCFATYCGASTDKKPEALEKVLKQQPHSIPTFETIKTELEAWIADYNATRAMRKGAEGLSPDQALATLPHTKRPTPDPIALQQCLGMWHRPIKVTRNGVRITLGTISYSYGRHDQQLRRLIGTGKLVHVRYDPNDMSRVEVYEEDMRHLCTATENNRIGRGGKVAHGDVKKIVSERRRRQKQRSKLDKTAMNDLVDSFRPTASAMDEAVYQSAQTAKPDKATVKHEPRDISLQPKPQGVPLIDQVISSGGLADLSDRIKRANEKASIQAKSDPQPVEDDEDIDVLSILASQHQPEPEDDDTDILSIFSEGGAA